MGEHAIQPQGYAALDFDSALTRDLAFYIMAGAGPQLIDLLNGRELITGSPTRDVGLQGYEFSSALSAAGSRLAGNTSLVTSDGAFTGDFSLSVFACPPATSGINIPYAMAESQAPESYFLFNSNYDAVATSGAFAFSISNGGAGSSGPTAYGVVDGNRHWFHVVRRGGTIDLWRDGVFLASAAAPGAIGAASRPDILLGYYSAGYGCPFPVESIIGHNRALEAEEIQAFPSNSWAAIDGGDYEDVEFEAVPTITASWTEQAETSVLAGAATVLATAAWVESSESVVASAVVMASATAAWTEAGEVSAAAAASTVKSSVGWTEGSEANSASASVGSGAALNAAWVEGAETVAVAAAAKVNAAVGWAEAGETHAALATVRINAAAGWGEQSDMAGLSAQVLAAGGPVDVSTISPARIVVFEGSGSRVTPFESSGSRVTPFWEAAAKQ